MTRWPCWRPPEKDFEKAEQLMLEYSLLPNDALIVAVMETIGITAIAALDEDF